MPYIDEKAILDLLKKYINAFPTCAKHIPDGGVRSGCLLCAFIEEHSLWAELDEAMAPEEQVAKHIKEVGGYVSSLDLTEGPREILNRAIEIIKKSKQNECRPNS